MVCFADLFHATGTIFEMRLSGRLAPVTTLSRALRTSTYGFAFYCPANPNQ